VKRHHPVEVPPHQQVVAKVAITPPAEEPITRETMRPANVDVVAATLTSA
jgi:hypothetical protein